MANTTIIPTLLAQNATATEMIGVVFQALTTPVGMIAAVLFTVLLSIIFLHQLTQQNGSFKVLQDSIAGITEDRRLQLIS
jgi:L-lactate permease